MVRRLFLAAVAILLVAGCDGLPPESPHNLGRTRPRVIVFTASWCGPCQRAKPFLVRIEASGADVQRVDIDAEPALAARYGVTSVPTFFVYISGKSPVRTQDIAVVVFLTRFASQP